MASPDVIVTGASGFIGAGLMAALGRARALSLRAPDWERQLELLGCGGAALVHLGGRAHGSGEDAATIDRDNHSKTLALARKARALGLRRFVFVSSLKVHGDASPGRPLTERDALVPADPYAYAKRDAEVGLAAIAEASGLEVVILRPPLVYGPGVRGNFLALLELAGSRWPLPFAALRNRRSLLSRANLVAAIEACVKHPEAAGRSFLIADGPPVSTAQLVTAVRTAMGRKAGLFPFPAAGLRAMAAMVGRAASASRLTGSLEVDDSCLRSTLGWRPVQGFDEAIGETVRWFRSANR